jgi:hypothetical protein
VNNPVDYIRKKFKQIMKSISRKLALIIGAADDFEEISFVGNLADSDDDENSSKIFEIEKGETEECSNSTASESPKAPQDTPSLESLQFKLKYESFAQIQIGLLNFPTPPKMRFVHSLNLQI